MIATSAISQNPQKKALAQVLSFFLPATCLLITLEF